MNNYYEERGNKTTVYVDGQAVLIDTDKLPKLTKSEKVEAIIFDKDFSPVVQFEVGDVKPLHVFLYRTKRHEKVRLLNGRYDLRHKHVKIT